jgi:hypothetical protein
VIVDFTHASASAQGTRPIGRWRPCLKPLPLTMLCQPETERNYSMTRTKWSLVIGLLVALEIEFTNYFLLPYPTAVNLPDGAGTLKKLLSAEWIGLHYLGLRIIGWIGSPSLTGFEPAILFFSGLLETAILIVGPILLVQWLIRRNREPVPKTLASKAIPVKEKDSKS